ncbi:MAG: 3-methyl-2-oxobutanoate hydroxymethyltransferase [Coriobacteriia bacterium]|nr:3-methyl-2-oxobutanoate hydroxymethyltransferase [Coriobacteriia bacterium]
MSVHPQAGFDRPVTTSTFRARKASSQRIVMVTAYDVSSARLVDAAGVDAILVGDSLGMTVLGHDSTLPVTMDDMLRASAAVVRGTKRALVIADMPFMSFQVSTDEALRNAGRLMSETGAGAVKLEGGAAVAGTVRRLTGAGIPVMGHVGLTPQSVHQLGGYRIQAKDAATAEQLLDDCRALQDAGAFAVVLECIPSELAALVSAELVIPTIGIGAGAGCDGEVQVFHDLLGLGGDFLPRHAKRYATVGDVVREAVASYADDVRAGVFPGEEQTVHMDGRALEDVRAWNESRVRRVGRG